MHLAIFLLLTNYISFLVPNMFSYSFLVKFLIWILTVFSLPILILIRKGKAHFRERRGFIFVLNYSA